MRANGAIIAEGDSHALVNDLKIGRGEGNDVRLDRKTVSRRHARLIYGGGRWCIEDCGSTNGTRVNGTRVPFGAPHPLHHGDRITVGSEVLVFSWPGDESDPDRTDEMPADDDVSRQQLLSPLQAQIVRVLCGAWVGGAELDALPSNDTIAASLGTPEAGDSVKAPLRRIYVKAAVALAAPTANTRRRAKGETDARRDQQRAGAHDRGARAGSRRGAAGPRGDVARERERRHSHQGGGRGERPLGRRGAPRLADGVELLGEYEDSGFKQPPHVARRSEGQVVQISGLLHQIAEESDGNRSLREIAERVSEHSGRGVSEDNVRVLVEKKLRPLGILAAPDGSSPELKKSDPLLALKFRAALVPDCAARSRHPARAERRSR